MKYKAGDRDGMSEWERSQADRMWEKQIKTRHIQMARDK